MEIWNPEDAGAKRPTIKAKKLVQKADVLVYSGSLIPPEILKYNKKGKKHDAAKLVREEIFDLLLKNSKKGKTVVRLHGRWRNVASRT